MFRSCVFVHLIPAFMLISALLLALIGPRFFSR